MSLELLKSLLDHTFYEKHKLVLFPDLIEREYQDLYDSIIKSHEVTKTSLTVDSLKSTHKSMNPSMSHSKEMALEIVYNKLKQTPDFDPKIQENILSLKVAKRMFDEIATIAMDLGDGKDGKSIEQLQEIIDKLKRIKNKVTEKDNTKIDIEEIFNDKAEAEELKWRFNLPDLQDRLGGIGAGYFGIVAARTDTGKTGFYISLAASEGGWLDQGAKVHIIGNEEATRRIKQRIISSVTGWTKKEVLARRPEVIQIWSKVKENCSVVEGFGMTIGALDTYCANHKPDILIIDQLDKIVLNGKFATDELRLRATYIQAREIAKKHNCAVIGICQASFAAHNKLHFGLECLEGSKTGKGAECDWCICIGMESDQNKGDNGYRIANIPKNKMTGNKKWVPFILEPDISRIHA